MDSYYANILYNDPIEVSDPATRKPLRAKAPNLAMVHTDDLGKNCDKCKWGAPDNTFEDRGKCMAFKNKLGVIWQRAIADYFHTTCPHFEAGEINFREHV